MTSLQMNKVHVRYINSNSMSNAFYATMYVQCNAYLIYRHDIDIAASKFINMCARQNDLVKKWFISMCPSKANGSYIRYIYMFIYLQEKLRGRKRKEEHHFVYMFILSIMYMVCYVISYRHNAIELC